jgi:hypothetical protein
MQAAELMSLVHVALEGLGPQGVLDELTASRLAAGVRDMTVRSTSMLAECRLSMPQEATPHLSATFQACGWSIERSKTPGSVTPSVMLSAEGWQG